MEKRFLPCFLAILLMMPIGTTPKASGKAFEERMGEWLPYIFTAACVGICGLLFMGTSKKRKPRTPPTTPPPCSVSDDEYQSEQWLARYTMTCPGCKVRVIKDKGCNKMRCSRCGTGFTFNRPKP